MDVSNTFLYMLDSEGIISEDEGRERLEAHDDKPFALLEELLEKNAAPKGLLGRVWGDSINVAYVDMDNILFQSEAVNKLPKKVAKEKCVIPLYRFGDVITVATADPHNEDMLREMEGYMDLPVNALFAFPEDILDAIDVQYQDKVLIDRFAAKIPERLLIENPKKIPKEKLVAAVREKTPTGFANAFLMLSMKERATDVHIEASGDITRVRFRIDGLLQTRLEMGTALYNLLSIWLKDRAGLDIKAFGKPASGRIMINMKGRIVEFGLSFLPTVRGEKIVLRVRPRKHAADIPSFDDLDFTKATTIEFKRLVEKPRGLFVSAGPSGAGKIATLYSALKHLNTEQINIMTVEDTAEYAIPGVNQVLAGARSNKDRPAILRLAVEQAPDILLISGINEPESAAVAVEAALAGCLVFASMQTDNAPRVLTRLVEMGIAPYLVSATVVGAMAQRMARRICEYCKESYPASKDELRKHFFFKGNPAVSFYRGRGCGECNHTGYSGQVAIYEIFSMNDEIRTLTAREVPLYVLENALAGGGFESLRYDGLKKVLRGLTTIEELDRILGAEDHY